MTESPDFMPRDGSPTIHVNIRSTYKGVPYNPEERTEEMQRMWREHQAEEANAASNDGVGTTKYDLSALRAEYEYDVVKCEDFVEDPGCWVRNMPEEIRRVNPDFVPT